MHYTRNINNLVDLVCDCHLKWLPRFINATRSRVDFSINHNGANCSDQGGISITDPSVNFDLTCRGNNNH